MKNYRLIIYIVIFILLSIAGIYWAIWHYGIGGDLVKQLIRVSPASISALAALYLLLYVTDIWRYQALGAAIDQPVRFITALETSIANDFFSWITPGAALGAPAAIYVMGKRGIAWDAATIICFAKSMLGSAVLLLLTFFCLVTGMSPDIHPAFTWVLLWGFGIVMLILIVPVVAALRLRQSIQLLKAIGAKIEHSQRLGDGMIKHILLRVLQVSEQAILRLGRFRAKGVGWMSLSLLVHIPYIIVFSAMIVVLLVEFGVPVSTQGVGGAIVYIGFTYVAPTPGASGLSEASASAFFGDLLAPADALAVVLLFRAATIYLHLLVGSLYLVFVGGLKEIMQRANRSATTV